MIDVNSKDFQRLDLINTVLVKMHKEQVNKFNKIAAEYKSVCERLDKVKSMMESCEAIIDDQTK